MNSRDGRRHANKQLVLSRIMLSLTVTIAVLVAPAAPIEFAKIRHSSCSPAMRLDPCQRCPLNSNQTNSNSTCCSVQAPCFVGYANASDDFVAGMQTVNVTHLTTDRFTSRSQRPPVPPPRIDVS